MNPLFKIFSIIEIVVSRQDTGATYSDIVKESELAKSSIHRILKDLVELGYLNFDPVTKRYFGSLKLAAIGAEVMANFKLRDHVHPFLIDLHRETGHTSNLGILDGSHGVFADKVESQDFGVKLFSEIGKTFPLHCTGLGKALLAFSPSEIIAELFKKPLEPLTDKTITTQKQLKKELAHVKERGYSVDDEEITRGIVCIAGPIFGFDQKLIGAISIALPASLKHDRGLDPEIEAIKKYSVRISESLSGSRGAAENKL